MIPMKNNDKAFTWTCNDCSEEPKLEKLAVRLQNVESNRLTIHFSDAGLFKQAFEAAKTFNKLVKEEKLDDLVYAPVIEDVEEQPAEDDIDKNKPAEEDGAEGEDD